MPQNDAASTAENVLSAVEACLDAASAEALARLRAPAELQTRIETLADRCTEGQLTDDEREEYETLVRLGNFVGILQARARRRLGSGQAA
jgi:transcription elongation GreA/GreB family factor